jgi:lipopolysaccharide export system protein LptC
MATSCILRPTTKYSLSVGIHPRLVKTDDDVTLHAGSQVNLGLKVELDTNKESSGLLSTVLICSALEELT